MADGTVLNAGSGGDTMMTDDLGASGKAQGVKVVLGANNTDGGYVADANPMPVYVIAKPKTVKVDVTRPADTTAYAVADAISNSTSAPTSGGFTIANAGRQSGGSCLITDVIVSSDAAPATRLSGEIFIFDQSVTNINDNTAFAVSDTERKNMIAAIPFSLFNLGNNGIAHVTGLSILCTCVGSADLRFLLRARNAYTPASGEVLSFTFKFLQLD
jgi:hypothetical protein